MGVVSQSSVHDAQANVEQMVASGRYIRTLPPLSGVSTVPLNGSPARASQRTPKPVTLRESQGEICGYHSAEGQREHKAELPMSRTTFH